MTNTEDIQNNKVEYAEPLSKSTKHEAGAEHLPDQLPEQLSGQETRETLTPLAFKIDKSLFGLALAVPWRRGAALTIDLFLVALLSEVPGELLALLVAVTLFNVGSKKRSQNSGKISLIRRTSLRLFAAVIVFILLIEVLPKLFSQLDNFNNNVEQAGKSGVTAASDNKELNKDNTSNDFIKVTLTLAANLAVSHSECASFSCWQTLSEDLASGYLEQGISGADAQQFNASLLENITEKSALTEQEIATIKAQLQNTYEKKIAEKALTANVQNNTEETIVNQVNNLTEVERLELLDTANQEGAKQDNSKKEHNQKESVATTEPENPQVYKGLAWLKGLVEDLGLGFGWAAFYFTMFTALWYGQTPGKRLFNIRVIQLDGTPLSVWDSFGRYGGYGAGIATGLLGFAQIFWDPNRQAIQDKISSTIVINDKGFGRKKYQQNITNKNKNITE